MSTNENHLAKVRPTSLAVPANMPKAEGEPLQILHPLPLHWTDRDAAFTALAEPFDPEDVFWLPQNVNYDDKTAIAAAYADKRAYSDRMDSVLGKPFWQAECGTPIIAPFTKIIKAKYDWKKKDDNGNKLLLEPERTIHGTKVFVVARVSVFFGPDLGWIWKESTGAADTDDENAITTAEAQAFKRACSLWGPGKYFYTLPKITAPYDNKKRSWKEGYEPQVPDWAIPAKTKTCKDSSCGKEIVGIEWENKQREKQYMSALGIIYRSRQQYNTELCADCQAARRKTTPAADSRLT
jgi:hypothetical protein